MPTIESQLAVGDSGGSRICGTHNTGMQPLFPPVATPAAVARAAWFLESAAIACLLDAGWRLEPIDVNRAALVPPADHWTGLGGES